MALADIEEPKRMSAIGTKPTSPKTYTFATWHGCNLAASGKEGDLFMTTELEDAVAKWIDKTAIVEFAKRLIRFS